jgi:hypothetical protein
MVPLPHGARALTLAELIVSMAIMTVLVTCMTSAVLIATHALPDENDATVRTAAAIAAADTMLEDLSTAVRLTQATSTRVEFVVPDRGHGAAGPETIAYEWSGTPGDALMLTYNGGTPVALCEDVHDFAIQLTLRSGEVLSTPHVLLIVGNSILFTAQDAAKRDLIESWGFTVTSMEATSALADLRTVIVNTDVMYISEQISDADYPSALYNAAIGIVNEEPYLNNEFGFAEMFSSYSARYLQITDASHEVLGPLSASVPQICSSSQPLYVSTGTLAVGLEPVADLSGVSDPALAVIETGGSLYGGNTAQGRRVKLPWGGSTFDINSLTADGQTLMRSAITWASAPTRIAAVKIHIQVGDDASAAVDMRGQLLNTPEQ